MMKLSHSERCPLKIVQHAHISRLVILLMDASSVSCLGSLVASSGRVYNEVGKHITQASQIIGALQKSVGLDNCVCGDQEHHTQRSAVASYTM